jgi:hypothetical protein
MDEGYFGVPQGTSVRFMAVISGPSMAGYGRCVRLGITPLMKVNNPNNQHYRHHDEHQNHE